MDNWPRNAETASEADSRQLWLGGMRSSSRTTPAAPEVKDPARSRVSPPAGGRVGGMLDDEGLERLAAKISAAHQARGARAKAAGSPG